MQPSRIQKISLFALLAAIFGIISQVSVAQEWERISEDKEKIIFQATDLKTASHSVWTKRDPEHKLATRQVSQWVAYGFYKSILYLTELADMHFTGKWPLSDITSFSAFDGKAVDYGATGVVTSNLGRVEYQLFKSQGHSCVVLRSYWGQQSGDIGTSEGTSSLTGYYCANKGMPLTATKAEEVIKAIGIKRR